MRIIKNRQIINSLWQLESDLLESDLPESDLPESDLPESEPATPLSADKTAHKLVSVSQWLAADDALKKSGHIGVYLQPTDEVESIIHDLDSIPVIALVFNGMVEGRGYSQAVELREQHHYQNEIRAIGGAADNLSLMERCGINAFQLDSEADLEQALAFFTDIDTVYPYN